MKIVLKSSWWMTKVHIVRGEFPMSGYVSTYCGTTVSIRKAQVADNAGIDEVSCAKCINAAS